MPTSNHDLRGMLRGTRKLIRKFTLDDVRNREKMAALCRQQELRWQLFYKLLERCRERGVVTEAGYEHLRDRCNVVADNWGCSHAKQ